MCDDREVFYRIRNNYIEENDQNWLHSVVTQQWLTNFRNYPFIKLVIDMMNLETTPEKAKDRWNEISGQTQIITKYFLRLTFGVDDECLRVQDGLDFTQPNLASPTLLDK